MTRILVSWLGGTDLRAIDDGASVGRGPIGETATIHPFDRIHIINSYERETGSAFVAWLQTQTPATVSIGHVTLGSPMDYGDIYRAARHAVDQLLETVAAENPQLSFQISAGTPPMTAVWVLLGKTRYTTAKLIQSSKDHGVSFANVPFDISAEFLPIREVDRRLETMFAELPPNPPEFAAIIHRSAVMKRAVALAQRVALHAVPVVLEGQSGTGKELFAQAIHRASPRREKPFKAINCGAIPENLIESMLFGYEKGAFTGADSARDGLLMAADGGTVFLDEIGELPLPQQVTLLRVLQEKKVARLNASVEKTIDVRIIAATNRNLIDEVNAGRFREDLYYRLAVAIIKLPPLHEREGDLSLLIDELLKTINAEAVNAPNFTHKYLSPGARNVLLQHRWPGNVRELLNTLTRAAIWSVGDTITSDDAREAILPLASTNPNAILDQPLDDRFSLEDVLATVARHYLVRAREETHRVKSKAARLLGFNSHQVLSGWLERHGVDW